MGICLHFTSKDQTLDEALDRFQEMFLSEEPYSSVPDCAVIYLMDTHARGLSGVRNILSGEEFH